MVKILYKSYKTTPFTRFGHEMATILVEGYLFKRNGSVNDDQNQIYFYCANKRKKSSSTSQKCHASVRLSRDTYKAEHGLVEIITEHCDQCLPKQNVQKEVKNDPSLNPMTMALSILCEEKWIRPMDLYQRLSQKVEFAKGLIPEYEEIVKIVKKFRKENGLKNLDYVREHSKTVDFLPYWRQTT